ncbi:CHAT domain-containing protein [Anaerolineales bacterium HSG24]|nr:CHAT domain-containing protein [Anaerolineales bacterium HSG24]
MFKKLIQFVTGSSDADKKERHFQISPESLEKAKQDEACQRALQAIKRAHQTSLQQLSLSKNRLSKLPAEIGELTSLQQLDLWNNQLSELPAEIGQLTNLQQLYLSSNKLSELPAEIGQLTSLQQLYLSSNELSELPAEIGQLTSLQQLDLNDNRLSELPAEVGQLTSLQHLNLYGNRLSELPAEIVQLTSLQQLDIRWNQLSELAAEIVQLTSLQQLDLSHNQLSELPAEIGQLTSLQQLDLSHNQLSELPAEIGQLTSLQQLDLSHNQLSELPAEIAQLTSLQRLVLMNNQLSQLPAEIGQLTSLQQLYLSDNKLSELPAEIGQLTSLQQLDLRWNQLSELPAEVAQLTHLTHLALHYNPKLAIPPEILGEEPDWIGHWGEPNAQAILDYYFQERKEPLNQAKLVLVGQGEVGKTSLVKRLIHNAFDPHEPITEGINIEGWQVGDDGNAVNPKSAIANRQSKILLNVWDFGGQEIMHATHQFFMTKRTLYLIVLDSRRGLFGSRLEYWLKLVQSFGGDSPIVVVCNKSDQIKLDLNRQQLQQDYPMIQTFLDTSCATGHGIAALRDTITHVLDSLPHVRDLIPAQWLKVKAELETMATQHHYSNSVAELDSENELDASNERDFIGYDEYETICQNHDISKKSEQRLLIGLLHDLGVVLNFQDDKRLKDTNVLNPHWVTEGVYAIITNKSLKDNQQGVLTFEQLPTILAEHPTLVPQRYPPERHWFLIEMMRKFELCFDFEGQTNQQWLIPTLLPPIPPDLEPRNSQTSLAVDLPEPILFEYSYHVLPDSIMARFIVRVHPFIDQNRYWQKGVLLVNDSIQAVVKANATKITLTVYPDVANMPASGKFLRRLRAEFEVIHDSFEGLELLAVIPLPECQGEIELEELWDCLKEGDLVIRRRINRQRVKLDVRKILGRIEDIDRKLAEIERQQAIKGYRDHLNHLRNTRPPQDFYQRVWQEGQDHYLHQEYTLARIALARVHEALQKLRGRQPSQETQQSLSAQSTKVYQLLVYCNIVDKQWDKAFEYATTAKGRAFVKQLTDLTNLTREIEQSDNPFGQLLRTARQLRQDIEQIEQQLEAGQSELMGRLQLLEQEENQLWQKMQTLSPILTATLSVPELTTAKASQLATDLQATLIEFYQHATSQSSDDYGWCAFVVEDSGIVDSEQRIVDSGKSLNQQSKIHYVPLPDLTDSLIQNLLDWVKGVELPTGTGRSKLSLSCLPKLYQAVIAPLEKYLSPDKPIIMAPFAQLHLLPLSAACNPAGRYLADNYTVTFVPSLTALHVAHEQTKRNTAFRQCETEQAEARFTDANSPAMLSVAYPGQGEEYLHNVLYEAEAIAQCFQPSELLKDEQATPDEVIKRAQNKQVLHLSCHGEFDSDQPEQSGLALAGNQWLTIQQIITNLKLSQTQLVSLAACRSGQMDIRQGEEHVGLLQAMLTAGAETVIASLWRVDDAATFELFSNFYNHIADQASPAQAMQQAMLMVRQRGYRQHPYYWAGFQVNGLAHQTIKSSFRSAPQTDVSKLINNMRQTRGDNSMDLDTMVDSANLLLKTMFENRVYLMSQLTESEQATVKAELAQLAEKIATVEDESQLWDIAHEIHCLVENIPALRAELMEELPPDVQVADRQQQRFKAKSIKVIKKKAKKKIYVAEKKAQTENHLNELRPGLEATSYERKKQKSS